MAGTVNFLAAWCYIYI